MKYPLPPAPPPSPEPPPPLWRRQGGQGRIDDITGRQETSHCSCLEHCFLLYLQLRPCTFNMLAIKSVLHAVAPTAFRTKEFLARAFDNLQVVSTCCGFANALLATYRGEYFRFCGPTMRTAFSIGPSKSTFPPKTPERETPLDRLDGTRKVSPSTRSRKRNQIQIKSESGHTAAQSDSIASLERSATSQKTKRCSPVGHNTISCKLYGGTSGSQNYRCFALSICPKETPHNQTNRFI